MLRNLVTSLMQHEQIQTTLPKARDAARLADRMISLGKKGHKSAERQAQAFLLDQSMVPKVFGPLAQRYIDRPGGYTRIHKYGNRKGDNAPAAILELVDNPRDLKLQMTARTIGWELLGSKLDAEEISNDRARELTNSGLEGIGEIVEAEKTLKEHEQGELRQVTRRNLQKVLRYQDGSVAKEISKLAANHVDRVLATPLLQAQLRLRQAKDKAEGKDKAPEHTEEDAFSHPGPKLKAGQKGPGGSRSAWSLAQGSLGRIRHQQKVKLGVGARQWAIDI